MYTESGNISFNDQSIIDPNLVFNSIEDCLRDFYAKTQKFAPTIIRIADDSYGRFSHVKALERLEFPPAVYEDSSAEIAKLSASAEAFITVENAAIEALYKRQIFPLRGMFHSITREIARNESDLRSILNANHWEGEKARTHYSLIEQNHYRIMIEIERR